MVAGKSVSVRLVPGVAVLMADGSRCDASGMSSAALTAFETKEIKSTIRNNHGSMDKKKNIVTDIFQCNYHIIVFVNNLCT